MKRHTTESGGVTRIQRSILTRAERAALDWICPRLPHWVTPDVLTWLALFSALVIGASYALSTYNPEWLWVAVAGYFVHWFGDSLDGSVARWRGIERPRYGYFIDHSCDCLGSLLMVGGLGLSPYITLNYALLGVIGYLLLAAYTFLLAKAGGEFELTHGGVGPTEIRVFLVALTISMYFAGPMANTLGPLSLFDLVAIAVAAIMMAVFLVQLAVTARKLARRDHRERVGAVTR